MLLSPPESRDPLSANKTCPGAIRRGTSFVHSQVFHTSGQ